MARSLFYSNIFLNMWSFCIQHDVHVVKRLPTHLLSSKCPYELMSNQSPSLIHLKVFGCLSFATYLQAHRTKFDYRSRKSIFLLVIKKKLKGIFFMTYKTMTSLSQGMWFSMRPRFLSKLSPPFIIYLHPQFKTLMILPLSYHISLIVNSLAPLIYPFFTCMSLLMTRMTLMLLLLPLLSTPLALAHLTPAQLIWPFIIILAKLVWSYIFII